MNNWKIPLFFGSLFLLYLLFPTNNSVADAYVYAANVKNIENLWDPHHLFYTPFQLALQRITKLDALSSGKAVNAFFATASCTVLFLIIYTKNKDKKKALLWSLIAAFSFSTIRFATENETYILPIFFSLLSSLLFLQALQKNNSPLFILSSSLFGILAICFHQIHLFWWLGILIGVFLLKKPKAVLLYVIPCILLPLVYFIIMKTTSFEGNILQFVAHDYLSGSASTAINYKNFLFTPISFFRSFFQIHPNILLAIKKSWFYALGLPFFIYFLVSFLTNFFTKKSIKLHLKECRQVFLLSHILIFSLQLGFAFFSHGNVEFMVMIPFLLCIFLSSLLQITEKNLFYMVGILGTWNLLFGLLIPNLENYKGYDTFMQELSNNEESKYILDDLDLYAKIIYETDKENSILLMQQVQDPNDITDFVGNHDKVYTNLISGPQILNRKTITEGNNSYHWDGFTKTKQFSYHGLYGTTEVYRLEID